jgi:hypothetical protein
MRARTWITVAVAVSFLLVFAGGVGARARAVAPPKANYFLSPAGADRNPCTRQAPCLTLTRGYAVAKPGQVVELADGTYPVQTLRPDGSEATAGARIFFRPQKGAAAHILRLSIRPGVRGIEFVRLDFPQGWAAGEDDSGVPASDVVFRNTTGQIFWVMNVSGLKVVGGSYGPAVDRAPQIKVYNPGDQYSPTDVLIDGVTFHDFTRSNSSVHTECLQVYAGLRVTIRRSRFTNCDGTGDLALTTLSSTRLKDVLVENNWFDRRGDAFAAVQADLSVEGLMFRYNSATKPFFLTRCTKSQCGSATLIGNYMPYNRSTCAAVVTYYYNVLKGGTCGPTDLAVPAFSFVDEAGFDLHLATGSAALCRGYWFNRPAVDIDGQKRPAKLRPDAGADQQPKRLKDKHLPRRCRVKPQQ